MSKKIYYFLSHPIQYQSPLIKYLTKKKMDIKVLYKNKLTSKIEHQGLKVPANTLTNILIKAQSPALIDFFSLDVEGYKFNVLEGIDFKKFNFKYFLIETKDNKRLINYLENKNYKFLENLSHHDFLFEFITIK